jgi:hypothetical protein
MPDDGTISHLADESALRRLVMSYAQACDQRDGAKFGSLFSPAAALEGPGFRFASPAQIRSVTDQLKAFEKTYHTILNCVVEISGDRASGEVYSMAHHLTPLEAGKYNDLVMYITYRDSYERSGSGWQFGLRRVVIEFTENRVVENLGSMPRS